MSYSNIAETREKVSSGEVDLQQVVQHFINQIQEKNGEINAFVCTYFEEALEQAAAIQEKIKNGSAGKLAGLVIGIKDAIVESGKISSSASKMLSNFESVYDATVIERLKAEDAIIIGRTNMDEFAMGSANQYSYYGPAKNPLDLNKVPGGSSGGSSAAVAAGMVNAALGSDTGGSIRQPAAYCGVVGLKPTYGRVSRHGLIAFASSFDCIGPITNTVEDSALILEVMAGFDEKDNTTSTTEAEDYTSELSTPNKKIKIGVPEEFFGEGLDEEIKAGINQLLEQMKADGAELVPIHLAHTKYGIATYYVLANAEASSNLARFDGIRYGHRADKEEVMTELKLEEKALAEKLTSASDEERAEIHKQMELMDSPLRRLYKKSRTEGFGTEVKRRIMLGTYSLSSGYYDEYFGKAQRVRRIIQDEFKKAFQKVDVIVSPTAPTTAFNIGEKMDDPVKMYLNDIYTTTANLAGICGISVKAGTHSNGLPYGVQFLGDHFEEKKVLNAARLVEELVKSNG